MKKTTPSNNIHAALVGVLVLTLSAITMSVLRASEKPIAAAAPLSLAQGLMGTWIHHGEPGKLVEPPAKGGFIKLRTAGHWAAIAVNPRSGLVTSTHGGTWRVNGNLYEENVEYGNEYHAQWIGKTYKWTVTLEGDVMTMIPIGNPWHEVWKRVK
jgi:hypothetical protein